MMYTDYYGWYEMRYGETTAYYRYLAYGGPISGYYYKSKVAGKLYYPIYSETIWLNTS